ncbi:hypothetical protein MVEN_02575800 [Mycena venus]|uniref:Uncharacterized protein n=1 Tax=Mycena venus TaxID=2733690 RepID=A0A8H6U3I7_9AGAR|nr:hypothetical protein MVEN_02575800 [Mycena venus]
MFRDLLGTRALFIEHSHTLSLFTTFTLALTVVFLFLVCRHTDSLAHVKPVRGLRLTGWRRRHLANVVVLPPPPLPGLLVLPLLSLPKLTTRTKKAPGPAKAHRHLHNLSQSLPLSLRRRCG